MDILFKKKPKGELYLRNDFNQLVQRYRVTTHRLFVDRFEEKFIADRPGLKWAQGKRQGF